MTCPRCDSEKEAGSRFCRSCGADLRGPCPDCGRNASMGCAYCRSCGRRLEPPPRRSAVETMALIAGLFGAVVLLVEIFTAWARIGDVADIAGAVSFGAVYWLTPAPESIIWLSGNWVILLYVVEAIIVTFCLYRLLREHLRISKEGRPVDSPAVRIPLIYSMVYVMNLVILTASGWDVSTPDIGESGSASDPNAEYMDLALPVDGGEVEVLAADLDLYNPTFTSAGGRLLIASNGQYAGATCGRLVSITYDGSNMVEYPLDEVA